MADEEKIEEKAGEITEPETDTSADAADAAGAAGAADAADAVSGDLPEENVTAREQAPVEEYDKKSYDDEAYEKLYTEILEHFRSFSPSEQIAGKITEEHITEYLEGNREERLLAFKERREKRFLAALELIAVLVAVVLVVWFLGDNPAILVNILYIIGGLGAFFIWKHTHEKK